MDEKPAVYLGEALARYGFGEGHPFGPDRHDAFAKEFRAQGLDKLVNLLPPASASRADLERFHTADYVEQVRRQSLTGVGYLDFGDTPAFPGIYEAACTVVGTVLDGLARIVAREFRKAFIPIAGLHHARRDGTAGFCVFNDCGVAIETLRKKHSIRRVAYVDIDAHHGDGVFYGFEGDPDLFIVDFHEDGRYLYPGTGASGETGTGAAAGTKFNIPMPPGADDALFQQHWPQAEKFLEKAQPELILLQCGADSIGGDPITHLRYSPATHAFVANRLCEMADRFSQGRLLAMGGGGYNRQNLAEAWCAVVRALVQSGGQSNVQHGG
jgi:acetoin utilization protein AcuC